MSTQPFLPADSKSIIQAPYPRGLRHLRRPTVAGVQKPQQTDTPASAPTDSTKTAEVKNPHKRVVAYDRETGVQLPYPVPISHLDGRFPNLTADAPEKEGK